MDNIEQSSDKSLASTLSTAASTTTVIKYEKTSCLFCNDWFDSQTFTEHLIHCGQVLEQCPNKCNAHLPRLKMRTHVKECPLTKQLNIKWNCMDQSLEERIQLLENEINTLRTVLNEEIRQRLHLITDVGNIRKQIQLQDEWSRSIDEKVEILKQQLNDEQIERCLEVEQYQKNFRYCCDIVQTLKNEIQCEMNCLEGQINQKSNQLEQHLNLLDENLLKLEQTMLSNEKSNRDEFLQLQNHLYCLKEEIKVKLNHHPEVNTKQAVLDMEVKNMKYTVCDTEERCEKLAIHLKQIENNLCQTAQLVSDIENQLSNQQRWSNVVNTRGHLVWRIKDFSKKLQDSKQYDTVLHSAMFSNKPFGYALRLDIYLNGKGTWKGRNMLACFNVINSEYDPILDWPCRLQAHIIIRDQKSFEGDSQDHVKLVNVRKKSDDHVQTHQFFHIPHKILLQPRFLRNDCIFVEVKILKN